MIWPIFLSSLILSLVILPLLAWKWKINIKLAVVSAIVVGTITGFTVSWLVYTPLKLNIFATTVVELVLIFIITFILAMFRFYRDPERIPPETQNVILSPADGKIIYISPVAKGSSLISTKGKRSFRLEEITSTDLLPDVSFLIGIEMNFLNVHVNRSPIGGRIILQKHVSGRFMSLGKPESEVLNERVSMIVDNGTVRIGMVQIASRLVRQIVSFLKEGDPVNPGQRIGMIRFGSQVDVAIPNLQGSQLNVRIGDTVRAGITVLARYGGP